MPSSPPVPPDITCRIALFLLADGELCTVARLRLLSIATYETVTPVLFSTFTVDGNTPALDIPYEDGLPVSNGYSGGEDLSRGETERYFTSDAFATRRRRLNNLRHVRHLVLQSAPSNLTRLPYSIFPHLVSATLSPSVTDSIRTFTPDTYDPTSTSPPLPPILEWLITTCKPRQLSLSFPLVPSADWAIYRDESTRGMYQLVSRLTTLGTAWEGVLEELEVRDIVHQVPPSLRGVRNIYHFADHLTSPSYSTPAKVLPHGPMSTGMSGPEWNYRAWQITTAIKTLFPSTPLHSTSARETLENTSWTFVNTPGHVLTKDDRDDDDEQGVEWSEVDSLVRDLVENGLKLDLPAREGFGEGELGMLFDKVRYESGGADGG